MAPRALGAVTLLLLLAAAAPALGEEAGSGRSMWCAKG